MIQHNHNGRFIAVVGEGEYVIYTSRQLRSKAYGEGIHFIWRQGSNQYCVQTVRHLQHHNQQNETTIKYYDDFKEKNTIQLPSAIKDVYGGACIGINVMNECVIFYDWDTQSLLQRIDGHVKVRVEPS